MNTHPNEDTLYDNVNNVKNPNEETMIDNNVVSNNVNNNGPKTKSRFGRVASGLGMGILLGGTSSFVTAKTIHAAEKDDINKASREWILLFQMASIMEDQYELMFGDVGNLYFYIRKKDLKECNFENVWLVLQCG